MSYILNALRKSEQERQAIKPETVTQRINIQQPLHQRNSSKLIAALLIANLAVLAYFLIAKPQTPPPATSEPTTSAQALAPVVKPTETPQAEITPPPLPPAKPLEQTPPSIATLVEAKIAPPPAPASLPAPKPIVVKKPLPVPEKPVVLPPPPIVQKVEKIEAPKEIIPKPAPLAVKYDLPYLEDLPADLRRSLPTFTINVFSYSPVPAQRFVMIDMVKYIPGQRIKDLLDLQEIREDSIVVGYNAMTFKIKRP